MTSTVLDDLTARVQDETAVLDEIVARDDFDPEGEAFLATRAKVEELNRDIKIRQDIESLKSGTNKLIAGGHKLTRDQDHNRAPAERLSLGEMFIRSDVYTQYPGRGSSSRMSLDAGDLLTRALPLKSTDWAGAFQQPAPRDITPMVAPTPLLDLIPAIPWASDVVNYITYAVTAGGAAVVAEGAQKPPMEFKPTATSDQLETIAVYTDATRQLLEASAAVKAKIDGALTNSVRQKAEALAAAALTAATLPTAEGATLLAAIRTGMASVMVAGYTPTAVLLHPADWASLDLSVFTATLGGPTVGQSFWGLRPVPSAAQPEGTATVGDFSSAMERYVRSTIDVFMTDSHLGNFTLNIFTILAESRELTAVIRPDALVECAAVTIP